MSEWNRGDREAEQRRYGQDNRVDRRDERRFGQGEPWRGGRQEGRSFDERDQERFGAGYGADYSRSQDRGRVEEAMYRPSSPRQPYDERQRQAQSYGRGQEDMRRGQGGIVGNNEPVRRVTDGETDHAMWSNMQGGQHRGRGPKNYTRSDQRISEDINDRLTDERRRPMRQDTALRPDFSKNSRLSTANRLKRSDSLRLSIRPAQ